MAGESPDRSKQRESSAEPTSGSAGPVPEARGEVRDPRLAVARDTEPPAARGGVDTATRVFSARDVAKARAAAQGEAESSDPPADEANPTGSESEVKPTGAEDAAAPEGPQNADKTDEQAPAAPEDADGAGGSEEPEDAAPTEDAQDAAEGPRDAKPDAGVSEGAEAPEDAAPATEDAAPATEDVRDAVPTDAAEGPRDAKPGAGASEAPEDAAEDATATEDVRDAAPTDAAEEPEDAAVAEGVQDAVPTDAAQDAEAGAPGGGGGVEGDARLRAAVAAWVRSGDAPATADTDAEDAAAVADERPASTVKADAGTHAPATDPRATANPSDADEGSGQPDQATRESESTADKPAQETRQLRATAAKPAPTPQDSAPARPAPAPQAADGEDAPQGPPAADDESRTGGAGGNTKAEGEAEARVDQPTTMLKLPSKFVALKPDVTTAIPQVGPERTTQQPLPPKPPLDLLAELTNTPPPPQTPLRTTFRRVKIWTPLVLLLAVVFAVAQAMRPLPTPTLELTAEDSYSFDGSKVDIPWPADGQAALDVQGIGSFGSSGDQKPVPIASVAKVMTAYVILRDHPLKSGAEGPKIKIDQTAEDQSQAGQESTVNVSAGDSITQREALESILIASANNVARLLARWDAGSEKAFVEKMNAAAEDLGMTNTTYTDPSGLNDTTVSTAVDQVKLGKKAMEEPAFREVAAMMSYDDYKGVNHSNWNQIVGKNNVVGIKTGTTTSALGNLLFAAKKEVNGETRTIVGAVVRQPAGGVDNTILSAALTAGDQLIRAAQGALESATIIKKGDVVGYVDDGLGGKTSVVATKDVTAVGWSGLTVKVTFAADDVPHTAKAGTKVGTLTVGDASAGAVKVPVALEKDLVEPGFTDKLTRVS